MSEIEKTREELKRKIEDSIDSYAPEAYSNQLEGFNLGVELAQKEFLDFLEGTQHNIYCRCNICNKIRELKQQLKSDEEKP